MDVLNILLYFIICVFTCYVVYYFYRLDRLRKTVNKFPGRKDHFFIGNIADLSSDREKLFVQMRELSKEFPSGYRLWSAFYASFVFQKANDVEVILSDIKYIQKKYIYLLLRSWLGTGLLTSEGRKWHQRRKILTPAFHFNILKRFVKIFGEHNETFIQNLEQECEKDKTNIMPLITKLTLDLICETAMGIKLESNNEKQVEYREAIHNLGSLIVERLLNPLYYINWIYYLFPAGRKFSKYIKILHQFTSDVIKERELTFKDSDVENLEDEEEEIVYSKKRFAMLDLLISAKRKTGEISDAGIREEVDTFMFEGHDTTSMAICFTIFCLANHKDIQDKARTELDTIFEGSTRAATYQDLQSMNYLDLVIKETLRLYPSVPFISRTVPQDVPFRDGEYTIPNDSMTHITIYDLHRDPEVFPNPNKFDPDRFLPENSKKRHPYSYIPFSAGPRNCIGQRFAILEVKSVISSILRYYEIDPIDTVESLVILSDLVLRPKNGIFVKFRPRTKY